MLNTLALLACLAQCVGLLAGFSEFVIALLSASVKVLLCGALCSQQALLGFDLVLNPLYFVGVNLYLLLILIGDAQLVDSGDAQFVHLFPGLLCHLLGDVCLLFSFSAPTAPRYLGGGRLDLFGRIRDLSRVSSSTLRALQIPQLACSRGLPVLLPVVAVCAAAGVQLDSRALPRFLAVACLAVLHALMLYRALARVGYLAPYVTAGDLLKESSERRRLLAWRGTWEEGESGGGASSGSGAGGASPVGSSAGDGADGLLSSRRGSPYPSGRPQASRVSSAASSTAALLEVESRSRQWRAVASVVFSGAALWYACAYRMTWNGDSAPLGSAATRGPQVVFALLSALACYTLTTSVPLRRSEEYRIALSLDDASLCPLPTQGPRHSVLIVIPSGGGGGDSGPAAGLGWDAAEACVVWYQLTRRGHSVTFASSFDASAAHDSSMVGPPSSGATLQPSSSLARALPMPSLTSLWGHFALSLGPLEPLLGECPEVGAAAGGAGPLMGGSSSPCAEMDLEKRGRVPSSPRGLRSSGRGSHGGYRPGLCNTCTSLASSLFPTSLAIGPWEWRGWGGLGSPQVAAMFCEMLKSTEFQNPIDIGDALGLRGRAGRREMAPSADAETAQRELPLPSFDGLILLGDAAVGASTGEERGEQGRLLAAAPALRNLSALLRSFWEAGQPTAIFSHSLALAAVLKDSRGLPLLRGKRCALPSEDGELAHLFLRALASCKWGAFWSALGAAREGRRRSDLVFQAMSGLSFVGISAGGRASRQQQHSFSSFSLPALIWRWMSSCSSCSSMGSGSGKEIPGFRPPRPHQSSSAFVVQDGHFISAQCGGDAFVLSKLFIDKLEQSSRTVF